MPALEAKKNIYWVGVLDKELRNFDIIIDVYKRQAEACTHAPLQEDIGRVKIPNMLRKKYGEHLQVTVVSGSQFPKDLSEYQLIIHCGACMFNRKHVLTRVEQAEQQGVPITNYGVVLAKLTGILDRISMQ